MDAIIYGPDPIHLDGRQGCRYWVDHLFDFTGNPTIDSRLSAYPVAVLQPVGRDPADTPIVVGLQGMAAPYQWNAFIVPTLLDMGIACVLFDNPLAGERSMARVNNGDVLAEVLPLAEESIAPSSVLVLKIVNAVARDFGTVLRLAQERHGLRSNRVALFGVSLGALLSAFAFTRDGIGQRLLGTIGHADMQRFARSYVPFFTSAVASLPGRMLGRLASVWFGPKVTAGIGFLSMMHEVCAANGACSEANPMRYASRVGPERSVRFLVGEDDRLVRPADAIACARQFPDGACYVVPGLTHGQNRFGPTFVEHVRYYLETQLGDWKW